MPAPLRITDTGRTAQEPRDFAGRRRASPPPAHPRDRLQARWDASGRGRGEAARHGPVRGGLDGPLQQGRDAPGASTGTGAPFCRNGSRPVPAPMAFALPAYPERILQGVKCLCVQIRFHDFPFLGCAVASMSLTHGSSLTKALDGGNPKTPSVHPQGRTPGTGSKFNAD